jgi:hypothetical protein
MFSGNQPAAPHFLVEAYIEVQQAVCDLWFYQGTVQF